LRALAFKDALGFSRRAVLGIATLAAFLLQIFVADTHWHWSDVSFGRAASAASIAASGTVSTPKQPAPATAELCQLCQALSASSRFISASAAAIVPPSAVLAFRQASDAQDATEVRLSHSWWGRAPPKSDSEIV
jgi:hypothetical protein